MSLWTFCLLWIAAAVILVVFWALAGSGGRQ